MTERQPRSSNIVEVDFTGETQTREFFEVLRGLVVLGYIGSIGYLLFDGKFYVAPLAAGALMLAVGAFEAAEQHYRNKKERGILQQPEPNPQTELVSRI